MKARSSVVSGFTLIELLIAAAIFLLLALMLLSVTDHVNTLTLQSETQTLTRQGARAALGLIQRDLEAAVLPLDRTNTSSLQMILNGAGIPAPCRNPDALFWHRAGADGTAAVGYFVRWKTNDGRIRADLYRFYAPASDTGLFTVHEDPENWVNADRIDALQWPLSENVAALYVTCWRKTASGTLEAVPDFDSRAEQNLPVLVSVSLLGIESRTLQRLSSADEITSLYKNAAGARELQALLPAALRAGTRVYESSFWLPAVQ
jgi:prepilin-type N-terminal cleavage/methylation domain